MINRIIKILLVCVMFVVVLSLGGYTFDSFSREVHLKDPKVVLSPMAEQLPSASELLGPIAGGQTTGGESETTTTDPAKDPSNSDPAENTEVSGGENTSTETGNGGSELPNFFEDPGLDNPGYIGGNGSGNDINFVDEDGNLVKQDIKIPSDSEISMNYAKSIKVKINDKELELSSKNTVTFVKWLNDNWTSDAKVDLEIEKDPETITTEDVVYNDTLNNETDLKNMVATIRVIDSLPDYDDYDRNTYEKPVKSYQLNGAKANRNDYAWKTSPWFDEETFTYMCPYTGTIINDLDDKKDDRDFGNLDYDHIVPLKSTYLRGAKDWTPEQMNEYAYNQWVGVDVLNSANRSKADKGPCEYMPDINQEDYCYSWLMICSKYNLAMTQEEIDFCMETIELAIENGETVEFLGGKMPE